MKALPATPAPLIGLGMTSLVLGTVALMLSIFPVLGVPLSGVGLLCGIVAAFSALRHGGVELRWTLAGIGMSMASLTVNIAIVYANPGYVPGREAPYPGQETPDRPYVPPPR